MTRKYETRLNRVFFCIAAVLICVFIVISVIFNAVFFRYQNQNAIEQSVRAKDFWLSSATETIHSVFTTITSSAAIDNWDHCSSRSDYFYYSAEVFKILSESQFAFSGTPFYPAIIKLGQKDDLVISSSGSSSISNYFKTETNLSSQQVANIISYFSKNSGELTIPVYDSENHLSDTYYAFKKPYGRTSIVYLLHIPLTSLMGFQDDSQYFIYNNEKILGYSDSSEQAVEKFDSIFHNIQDASDNTTSMRLNPYSTTLESVNVDSSIVYLSELALAEWKIAYVYDAKSPYASETILYMTISFLVSSLLLYAVFRKLSHWLYEPFQLMLDKWIFENTETEIDEFQLMQQKADTAKQLLQELQTAMQENASLLSQKFYRDLLLGMDVSHNKLYQPFLLTEIRCCVALFEFHENENEALENDVFFSKSKLLTYTQHHTNITAVNTSHTQYALILRISNFEDAREIVQCICNEVFPKQDFKISISSVCTEISQLHNYYKQACNILEYKYLYLANNILTPDQVANHTMTDYYYPIMLETRMIHLLLKGDESCIDLFDKLLQENFENASLSPEAVKSFVYALLGTMSRAFQELKLSCEELLGISIDYEKYYANWNSPETLTKIRNMFLKILQALQLRNNNSDNQTLELMKSYIYSNYSKDISLRDVADTLFISPKYCSCLFKKLSKDTFKNFLNHYRIEQAKVKIENNPNIKIVELSQQVGFNSSNSFIRVFSKYTGMTPGSYIISFREKPHCSSN